MTEPRRPYRLFERDAYLCFAVGMATAEAAAAVVSLVLWDAEAIIFATLAFAVLGFIVGMVWAIDTEE